MATNVQYELYYDKALIANVIQTDIDCSTFNCNIDRSVLNAKVELVESLNPTDFFKKKAYAMRSELACCAPSNQRITKRHIFINWFTIKLLHTGAKTVTTLVLKCPLRSVVWS